MHDKTTRSAARKKPTYHRYLIVILMIAADSAIAETPLDETAIVRRVCTQGPDAQLARAKAAIGAARVAQAGVLPNPVLSAEHQRALDRQGDGETIVGLSVPLGIGGRRFVLQDAAEAWNEEARLEAQHALFDAALSVRELYADAVLDRARAEILGEQQRALDMLAETVHRLTAGGELAGYDALRQETAARAHRRLWLSARTRAEASRTILEAWAGEKLELDTVAPRQLAISTGSEQTPAGDHPRLQMFEAEVRARELEATAARRRWVPDLDVFAGYRQTTAGDELARGISMSLSLPITLFDHGQGEARFAEAEAEVARAHADRARARNRAELKAAETRLAALALEDHAENEADAARLRADAGALYAAGEATITEVLEAFKAAEEARLGALEAAEEMARLRLFRMRAAGSFFDAELDRACRVASRIAP